MIELKDIPQGYAYCFAADSCPRSSTCLRADAARALEQAGQPAPCILRTVNPLYVRRADSKCPYYNPNAVQRYARGMTHLFDNVPSKHSHTARLRVQACFSCRTYYYHCHRGKRLITPEEQKAIGQVFRSLGMKDAPAFDSYEDAYDWQYCY